LSHVPQRQLAGHFFNAARADATSFESRPMPIIRHQIIDARGGPPLVSEYVRRATVAPNAPVRFKNSIVGRVLRLTRDASGLFAVLDLNAPMAAYLRARPDEVLGSLNYGAEFQEFCIGFVSCSPNAFLGFCS
jgi:hypothetical protein